MHQQPEKDPEEGFFNMLISQIHTTQLLFDLFWGEGLGLTQNHVTAPQRPAFPAENTSFPKPLSRDTFLLRMSIGLGLYILSISSLFLFHSPKWL